MNEDTKLGKLALLGRHNRNDPFCLAFRKLGVNCHGFLDLYAVLFRKSIVVLHNKVKLCFTHILDPMSILFP